MSVAPLRRDDTCARSPLPGRAPPTELHLSTFTGGGSPGGVLEGRTGRDGQDPSQDGLSALSVARQLTAALVDGETAVAEALLTLTWRQSCLADAHRLLAWCMQDALQGATVAEQLSVKTMTAAARSVLERLRASTTIPQQRGVVVLAVPPGDPHVLSLVALAHHVELAGWAALIVEDLPFAEVVALASWPSTAGVVISAHQTWRTTAAQRAVALLRRSRPDLVLVLGGPGAPPCSRHAAVVTSDPEVMVAALGGGGGTLTDREREVLLAVAEGATNSEIAELLGLSASTVKTHLDRVFDKTGTVHRAAAVAHALRSGWIS